MSAPSSSSRPSVGGPPAANAELLTMGSLRDGLHAHLRESGALTSLKTQLRAMVLTEITRSSQNTANSNNNNNNAGAIAEAGASGKARGLGALVASPAGSSIPSAETLWSAQLANRLVESHLRNTKKAYSHNIFVSESGLGTLGGGAEADGELCAAIDVPLPTTANNNNSSNNRSPLVALVSKMLHARCAPTRTSASAQTDANSALRCGFGGGTVGGPLTDPLMTVEQKLALIDAQHAIKYAHIDHGSKATQEAALRRYKEEMGAELRREMEQRLAHFRATELSAARRDEEERYRLLLARKGEEAVEAERTAAHRAGLERERLEAARHDLEAHRQAIDKRGRDMLALAEEREHSVAHLEKLIADQKGTIQRLHLQLTQLEGACADQQQAAESWRLREHRRAEDLRRVAAEHMAELRAKDEEAAALRYRLKVSAEEYRHHMDRMSLDVRMVYQQGEAQRRAAEGVAMGMGGGFVNGNLFADPMAADGLRPPDALHPYDRATMEAAAAAGEGATAANNKFPDYRSLLSQAAPMMNGKGGGVAEPPLDPAAMATREYRLPLHATAAKYLQQQPSPSPAAAAAMAMPSPSAAAASDAVVAATVRSQQQQQPSAGNGFLASSGANSHSHAAAPTLPSSASGISTATTLPSAIPTPRPIEAHGGTARNATTGVRLTVSPTRTASFAPYGGQQQQQQQQHANAQTAAAGGGGSGGLYTPPRGAAAAAAAVSSVNGETAPMSRATTYAPAASGTSPSAGSSSDRRPHRSASGGSASASSALSPIARNASGHHSHSGAGGGGVGGSRSPSSTGSGGGAASASPVLPTVQRRKSPVVGDSALSPQRGPSSSLGGHRSPSSSSSSAPHSSSSSSSPSSASKGRRPVLDLQREREAEAAAAAAAEKARHEAAEAESRRQKESAEAAKAAEEAAAAQRLQQEQQQQQKEQREREAAAKAKESQKTLEASEEPSARAAIAAAESTGIVALVGGTLPSTVHAAVGAAEDVAFRAIMWSHTSARDLIKAKEEEGADTMVYGAGAGGGILSRDSDDSDGGVNIFGRGSDSDSDSDW